jgi:hypothetical protein
MINHKSFVHIIRHLKSLSIITAKQPRNTQAKNMSTTTLQYKHQLRKMTELDKQLAKAMDADPDSAKWCRIWRIRIHNHNFFIEISLRVEQYFFSSSVRKNSNSSFMISIARILNRTQSTIPDPEVDGKVISPSCKKRKPDVLNLSLA